MPDIAANQSIPASDRSAVADGAPRSERAQGAENGRAFDQAVTDGKSSDRSAANNSSTASAGSGQSNTSAASTASNTPVANGAAAPAAGGASDAALVNGGSNAPAASGPPNAAVANGPSNAPVGNGVSNAPIANGSANPAISSNSTVATLTTGRTDAPLATGSANPTASNIALQTSGPTPPPNAPDGAARPDLTLRPDQPSRLNLSSTQDNSALVGRSREPLSTVTFDLPVLQLGSSDRTVGLLQRALAVLGFLELLSERGFGAFTDQAVRSFQEGLGLTKDGVVGNRETWPALNKALVSRHEGITRLADAMMPGKSLAPTQSAEMRQLGALLGEFSDRALPTSVGKEMAFAGVSARELAAPALPLLGEAAHAGRASQAIADAGRALGLPVSALVAANAELSRSYLVLQGQLLTMPNPVKERKFRRQPKQLHAADPEGHLANVNMNPDFVSLVNGMIGQLRGEGHDVRVTAGYRSFAEQQERFDQGRSTSGKVLTDAKAGHSWHNYGLAVDMILNDEEGNPAWPEASSPFWQRLADVALARGAVWGGRFGYPAHIEYHPTLAHDDAGTLIEDFESYGLDAIWEKLFPEPEGGESEEA